MDPITYSVTIKNGSGDTSGPRSYFVYFAAPTITGNSGRAAQPVVFKKFGPLSNGGRATFSYTSELFGYVGNSTSNSASLKSGDTINLDSAVPATITQRGSGGTVLQVKSDTSTGPPSIRDNNYDPDDSPARTFGIYCDSGIAYPNYYTTGLARNLGSVGEAPTMALPAISGQTFTIAPSNTLYIVKGSDNQGTIVTTTATAENSYTLDFAAGRASAVITNITDATGKSGFSVSFS